MGSLTTVSVLSFLCAHKAYLCILGGALSERSVAWLLWSIGAGIYVQGHGIHLAAAMFKVKNKDLKK